MERLLNEIRKGYLAVGDARVELPGAVDLKMELEDKEGRLEFELELAWGSPAQEEKKKEEEEKEGEQETEKA
ncbi:MAG: hypothetical protein ACPLQO_05350 [Desulfotomaculales bacterium]